MIDWRAFWTVIGVAAFLTRHFNGTVRQAKMAQAIAAAEEHADPEWLHQAGLALIEVALLMPEFYSDAVWKCMLWQQHSGAWPMCDTHEHRAMGAVFLRAAKAGIIRSAGRTTVGYSYNAHGHPVTVWKSNICEETVP